MQQGVGGLSHAACEFASDFPPCSGGGIAAGSNRGGCLGALILRREVTFWLVFDWVAGFLVFWIEGSLGTGGICAGA